jgi:hypothetical protein
MLSAVIVGFQKLEILVINALRIGQRNHEADAAAQKPMLQNV